MRIIEDRIRASNAKKERIATMLYVLHSHCRFDFGPMKACERPARDCGMRPRTGDVDDTLRGNHGKDSRTDGASTYRSP